MRKLWEMLRGATARKGYVALIDQAIVSGTNFAIAILLARFCTVEEYGGYVLAFSVMLILNGLQESLITGPMTFLSPSLSEKDSVRYTTGLFLLQVLSSVLCGTVLFGVILGMHLFSGNPAVLSALIGLAVALAFAQVREYLRRSLFTRLQPGAVLLNDVLYCIPVLASIYLLKASHALNAQNIFFAIAGASLLGCLIGFLQVRHTVLRWGEPLEIGKILRTNWAFGKWQLLGTAGSYGYLQANTFILAAILGATASARLHATRNLLAPIQLLVMGIGNVAAPWAAGVYSKKGRSELNRSTSKIGLALIAITLAYGAFVVVKPELLLRLFYGDKYLDDVPAARLWVFAFLVLALRRMPSIALSAMRRPDIVVIAGLVGGITAVGLCFPCISLAGVSGAIVARLAGEIAIFAWILFFFFRKGLEDRPVVKEVY